MGRLIFALCLVMLCLGSAQAQNASISGSVSDPSGAVVAKASIDLVNRAASVVLHTETSDSGPYTLPFVKPPVYNIRVQEAGSKTLERTGVALDVGQNARMDFLLEVGAATHNVEVSGSSVEINTTDASVSTVIDRHFVENLPLNGRSFQSLLYITPGVTPSTYAPEFGRTPGGQISIVTRSGSIE
jgi:Carboxypeptidase regulatory-like domain